MRCGRATCRCARVVGPRADDRLSVSSVAAANAPGRNLRAVDLAAVGHVRSVVASADVTALMTPQTRNQTYPRWVHGRLGPYSEIWRFRATKKSRLI